MTTKKWYDWKLSSRLFFISGVNIGIITILGFIDWINNFVYTGIDNEQATGMIAFIIIIIFLFGALTFMFEESG